MENCSALLKKNTVNSANDFFRKKYVLIIFIIYSTFLGLTLHNVTKKIAFYIFSNSFDKSNRTRAFV